MVLTDGAMLPLVMLHVMFDIILREQVTFSALFNCADCRSVRCTRRFLVPRLVPGTVTLKNCISFEAHRAVARERFSNSVPPQKDDDEPVGLLCW